MGIEGIWAIDTEALASNLNASLWQYGAESARPTAAAGNKGVCWVASDTLKVYRSTGSAWELLIDKDTTAGTASLRTLGNGSTQAKAGNHTTHV